MSRSVKPPEGGPGASRGPKAPPHPGSPGQPPAAATPDLNAEIVALRDEVRQLREAVNMLFDMVANSGQMEQPEEESEEREVVLDRNPRLRTGM